MVVFLVSGAEHPAPCRRWQGGFDCVPFPHVGFRARAENLRSRRASRIVSNWASSQAGRGGSAAPMRLAQGENHVISAREGLAVLQVWMRPDLSPEEGAKNAGQMTEYLSTHVLR